MTGFTWRFILAVASIAAAITAAYALSRSLRGASTAYYDVPPVAVVVVFVAALLVTAGISMMLRGYDSRIAALSTIATGLLVLGVIGILTIGLLFLLAALPFLVALGRAMNTRPSRSASIAALSGTALGLGLIVLWIAATRPPVVECLPGGGVRGSSAAQSSSGLAVSSAAGVSSGTMTEDGVTIRYTCRNGRLVEFRRE